MLAKNSENWLFSLSSDKGNEGFKVRGDFGVALIF